ncbi:MAG: hypothetical protein O8C60_05990, partial [Candidatus Methanoperedens sp.]|nr:hypothetical protein [Candidatus Methanoperedens sp.]
HRGMLYPALPQYSTFPVLVLVAELPTCAVSDYLIIAVRMQRPYCAGRERIIVKHTQGAEVRIFWIVVLVKGEVPPPVECTVLDLTACLIDGFRIADCYHQLLPPLLLYYNYPA